MSFIYKNYTTKKNSPFGATLRGARLAFGQRPCEGRRIEFELAMHFADDTLEDVLGSIADELDASTDGLGNLDLVLPCFSKVKRLAWDAAVVKQRHDLDRFTFG